MSQHEQKGSQYPGLAELIAGLPQRVTPERLRGMNAVVHIRSIGDDGGEWTIVAKDQGLRVETGRPESVDLSISAKSDVWAAVLSRKLDPTWAYMSGQLQVSGDINLAMRLQSLLLG